MTRHGIVLPPVMILLIATILQNQFSWFDAVGIVVLSSYTIFIGTDLFYRWRDAGGALSGIRASTEGLSVFPGCWIAWDNISRVRMRRSWMGWDIDVRPICIRKFLADQAATVPLFYRVMNRVFIIRSVGINSGDFDGDPELLLGFINSIVAESPGARGVVVRRAYDRFLAIREDIRDFADFNSNFVERKNPADPDRP